MTHQQPPTHEPYTSYPDYRRHRSGEPSTPAFVGAAQSDPGATAHIIALIAGVPVALLMLGWVASALLWGDPPSLTSLLLGGSATGGCVLAVRGMRSRPRRHRTAALILTVVPALVVGLFVVLFAVLVTVLGNMNF